MVDNIIRVQMFVPHQVSSPTTPLVSLAQAANDLWHPWEILPTIDNDTLRK